MPTPMKDPSVRRRRNREPTAATLSPGPHTVPVPDLPDCRVNGWHPQTSAWWADIWASPMAPQWTPADRRALALLAVLVDDFWWEPSASLAAEIRLQRQCFGLTPVSRRRLGWTIRRGPTR